MVYWNDQDVICATIGGIAIAISTTLNLILFGRITGLSGTMNSVFKFDRTAGFDYKLTFTVGLFTIPALLFQIFGNSVEAGAYTLIMFDSNDEIAKK